MLARGSIGRLLGAEVLVAASLGRHWAATICSAGKVEDPK